ncbi:hypothetical protein NQZ68_038086 [Dissostichus eleginoides]|nr:hypothetical protein NQZ68_038086 [Dissostichus eleginoides]
MAFDPVTCVISHGGQVFPKDMSPHFSLGIPVVDVCLFLGGAASPGLRGSSVQRVCTAAVCVSNVQSGEARIGHRESRDLNAATFWLALSLWDRTALIPISGAPTHSFLSPPRAEQGNET